MAEKKRNSEGLEIAESQTKKSPRLDTKSEPLTESEGPKPVNREGVVIKKDDFLNGRYLVLGKVLGQGSFAKVLDCWDDQTRTHVALKVCRGTAVSYTNAVQNEVRNLKRLALVKTERPRFVKLIDFFKYGDNMCIVLEKLGPNLFEVLETIGFTRFPIDKVREFGAQILEAVASMHEIGLIHTDLKPKNVHLVLGERKEANVLSESCDIKLIHFGGTVSGQSPHSFIASSSNYRAPEVILGLNWTSPCDIWSIGSLLLELSTGPLLFEPYNDLEYLAMMEKVLGPLPENMIEEARIYPKEPNFSQGRVNSKFISRMRRGIIESLPSLEELVSKHVKSSTSASFVDLLKGLLKYDPKERLTAPEALALPFFQNPT